MHLRPIIGAEVESVLIRKESVLELVRRERECEIIDRKLVKEVVEIFVDMGGARNSLEVYVQDFEDMLLSTTADFYSRESSKWAEEDSFPDYMRKAEDRLQEEQQRVANYFHSSTEEKLLKVCDEQLLQIPEQNLLEKENSGCEILLRDKLKIDHSVLPDHAVQSVWLAVDTDRSGWWNTKEFGRMMIAAEKALEAKAETTAAEAEARKALRAGSAAPVRRRHQSGGKRVDPAVNAEMARARESAMLQTRAALDAINNEATRMGAEADRLERGAGRSGSTHPYADTSGGTQLALRAISFYLERDVREHSMIRSMKPPWHKIRRGSQASREI